MVASIPLFTAPAAATAGAPTPTESQPAMMSGPFTRLPVEPGVVEAPDRGACGSAATVAAASGATPPPPAAGEEASQLGDSSITVEVATAALPSSLPSEPVCAGGCAEDDDRCASGNDALDRLL